MKRFFTSLNMERWVILVSLIAALGLGGVGYFKFRRERVELQDALAIEVPKTAQDIEVLAQRYSKLYKEADLQGLYGQNDPQSTIRDLATRAETGLGQIDLPTPSESTPRRGVKDIKYTIRPQDRNRAFDRNRIANFLYLLEFETHHLRVTRVRLEVDPKNLKPFEMPPERDLWRWEGDVTSRQKAGDTK